MKSFRPKAKGSQGDDDPGDPPTPDTAANDQSATSEPDPMPRTKPCPRTAEVDSRGEKCSNATHTSTTDPDARLYKKAPGTALCFIGHGLMDMRHVPPSVRGTCRLRSGLIVEADLARATARAERQAAIDPRHGHSDPWRSHGSIRRHSPGPTRRLTLGADRRYDVAEFVADLRQA